MKILRLVLILTILLMAYTYGGDRSSYVALGRVQ